MVDIGVDEIPLGIRVLDGLGNIVLDEGNSDCSHKHVNYIDNAFDGQAFWCDDCSRHERMNYSPYGERIKFPKGAFIRTPNPDHGDSLTYSHQADENGVVHCILPPDKRFRRE